MSCSRRDRVIIVGGGLSGLRCSSLLINRHGFSKEQICLLEASARIGGRVKTDTSFVQGFSVSLFRLLVRLDMVRRPIMMH